MTDAPTPARTRVLDWILVIALFATALGFGVYRAQFGMDFGDEGLYVTAPMRYALGDLPFRDEIINPQRGFDIVLAPLFWLHPSITVYQLRCLNVCFEVAIGLLLFLTLRRYCAPVPLAAACVLALFVQNLCWLPNYHNLSSTISIAAWCLWQLSARSVSRKSTVLLAAVSGAVLFVGVVIYLPLAAVLAVPGIAFLVHAARKGVFSAGAVGSVVVCGTVVALFIGAIGVLALTGLLDDYLYATTAITSAAHYALTTVQKILFCWQCAEPDIAVLLAAAGAAYWIGATLQGYELRSRMQTYAPPAVALLVGLLIMFVVLEPSSRSDLQNSPGIARYLRVALMSFGLHLGLFLLPRKYSAAHDDGGAWRFAYASAFVWIAILAATYSILSMGVFKLMLVVPMLFPLAIAAIGQRVNSASSLPQIARLRTLTLLMFALPMICATYYLPWRYVMKAQDIADQTAPYQNDRFKGIYALPSETQSMDAVAEFFTANAKRGDYLIVYTNIPAVYYMTGMRPALDQSWTDGGLPLWVTENSLEYMIQNKRVPRYCVRFSRTGTAYSSDPRKDPLNALVERHYTKVKTVPYTPLEPFCDIFELRADSPLRQYTSWAAAT